MKNGNQFDTCLTADSAEVLFAYIDGTLEPVAATALLRHAGGCEPCRKLIEGQQAMWSVLDEWEAPEISPDFNRNLHAAVAAGEASRSWMSRFVSWATELTPKSFLVPAGALALVMATVMVTQMPRHNAVQVEEKAGIENEVKQIEKTLDDLDVLTTLDAAISTEEKL